MNKRARLFPVLVLALAAGCSPAPGDSARSGNTAAPAIAVTNAANDSGAAVAEATPAPASAPASSRATVRPAALAVEAPPTPLHPLDLPPSDDAAQVDPFPGEVTAFMVDRDGCDHFRGEEPYDAERRAYLEENIAELCTGTDAKLAMLRRRYGADPAVTSALGGYEDRIEGSQPETGENP